MSEGQREARSIQRWAMASSVLLALATFWQDDADFDRLMIGSLMMIATAMIIYAMRALAKDMA